MKRFKPQEIKTLDGLTLTEQKVLAFHFSPKRTDCVTLGYEYDIDIDRVWVVDENRPIEVTDELNETSWDRLAVEYGHEQMNWKKFVFDKLQSRLDNAKITTKGADMQTFETRADNNDLTNG